MLIVVASGDLSIKQLSSCSSISASSTGTRDYDQAPYSPSGLSEDRRADTASAPTLRRHLNRNT